ncbi:MAG: SDR family NAD(P)-dependent oxidoreductase [Myxococcaceae bacterium]|nr:SDR family NAD(P)-dependent oxidoreductase [Myxococcaceae bacterium]
MGRLERAMTIGAGVGVGALLARTWMRAGRRYELRDRTVLITGSSRGLGLALAREFARRGAKLALCARDADELNAAREELAASGAEAFASPCDITDPEQVKEFLAKVADRFGEVDVLVNNAGVLEVGPLEAMTPQDFEEAMRTHFYGPLNLTLSLVPAMRRRRDGRVVNISSIGGLIAVPHLLPYAASKFALTGFSEGLRTELAADNVWVTTVCPGLMRTGSPRHAWFKGHPLKEYRWFLFGATLPVLTVDPARAAKKIVDACVQGRALLVVGAHFKAAAKLHALFPELTSGLLAVVDELLPRAFDGTREKVEGTDLEPPRGGGIVDRLNRFAARRFNEYAR